MTKEREEQVLQIIGILDVGADKEQMQSISEILDDVWHQGYNNGCFTATSIIAEMEALID